jgi:hypothetical protein
MKTRNNQKLSLSGLVLTLPIPAGKVEAWRRFCQELSGSRQQLHAASRRRLGITRERLVLVETPFGSASVTMLEAHDMRQALAEMINSDLPFESWYRKSLEELHGVSLASYQPFAPPRPPDHDHPQELLFEWLWPDKAGS